MAKLKNFEVPFAFQMYGNISVVAESEEEAVKLAEAKLEKMGVGEMLDASSYLPDSEEIDEGGIIRETYEYKEIVEAINNNFDNPDLDEPAPGVYDIQFYNQADDRDDETEFDLDADEGLGVLELLWADFAKENGLNPECVTSVTQISSGLEVAV